MQVVCHRRDYQNTSGTVFIAIAYSFGSKPGSITPELTELALLLAFYML